jgi:hypothetical protein
LLQAPNERTYHVKIIARLALAAASAALLTAVPVAGASASPSGDPNAVKVASPAHACAAIPGTLAQFDIEPEGFSFTDCVKTLAGRVPNVDFGSPYEQCAALEAGIEGFQIEYPYVFHAEPDDPFPNLKALTREQCARALYVFHTVESYLPPPP